MRLVTMDGNAATVQFTEAELCILNNALNEVCNGIEVPEFAARMGAEKSEVIQLLKQMHEILG